MPKPIPPGGFTRKQLREAVAQDYLAIVQLVRGALENRMKAANPGSDCVWVDIEAVFPDRVIVCQDGKCYAYPYTLGDGNVVALGDPVEVMETYVPVKEARQEDGVSPFREAIEGGKWLIRIIRAGASLNGNYYPDAVLREAAPLFEGARVFVKPDEKHIKGGMPDFNDLIAGLSAVRFVEGAQPDTGELVGVMTLIQPDGNVAIKIQEAFDRGLADLFGFSIDATARTKRSTRGGVTVREAVKFVEVKSVDLIVQPGAGGELIRLIEAVDPRKEENMKREDILRLIEAKAPQVYKRLGDNPSDAEVLAALTEALATPAPTSDDAASLREAVSAAQQQFAMLTLRTRAAAAIAESTLPAAAKAKLSAHFDGAERFVEADIATAIAAEREYLAKLSPSGRVTGVPSLEVGDRSVQIGEMLEAFFNPEHKDHRSVQSIKEVYVEITGDRRVSGMMADVDRGRLAESLGVMREALDSTSWSKALGNSITRRMQEIFTGLTNLQSWRRVADVVPLNDFRTQERFRVGGYGNLPTVNQAGTYQALGSPTDAKSTYAATKRGGLESVTREMIKNDDVGAIRLIPKELALAAANTLYEFVFDVFRTNPTIYDALPLYHATHGNLFTGALSAAEFSSHRLAMVKQTRAGSGKRLYLTPGYALVPVDLEETAFNLFVRNTNLDPTFVQSLKPEVIPIPYWTDTNDFNFVAREFAPLEVGFIDGQEEPSLFVQDLPNAGSLFYNDVITYKIRHEYGGAIKVDGEKATTKAMVP